MKANFSELIHGDVPVLIDFHAEWCGPCKMQSPIIKEIAQSMKDKLRVIKIDVDKNPSLSRKYKIRGVPTLALFKDGELKWMQAGMKSKQQILKVIDQFGGA
ncbi:MAG TPA: thioredoxin [Saprospiraceae bacterium]|nr:thioredoxin [Saprospiraceae bacterium]MCB9271768.1 thioredoxin [Lewinellaceae bacterium]HPG07863.1 thioredoxin [Saprospiraceae bacterium]HPR00683.1 thioredoxin [Saprospiraceae bacterium]HQU54950.1 thioredoxin [Saprospiraceae bacterium]